MFSKQSKEFLERDEKIERRLKLWNGAVSIIKALSQTNCAADDCGWRGDHRDVDAVADYIGGIDESSFREQISEAATWINDQRDRDPHGLHNRPVVRDVLNHLRRKFPHG